MKKLIFAFLVAATLTAFLPVPQTSKAQTLTNAQISAEITTLANSVTTLSNVETIRRGLVGSVNANIAKIVTDIQVTAALPINTDSEKAIVAARLAASSEDLKVLIPLVSGLAQTRTYEVSILALIQARLVALSNQLTDGK